MEGLEARVRELENALKAREDVPLPFGAYVCYTLFGCVVGAVVAVVLGLRSTDPDDSFFRVEPAPTLYILGIHSANWTNFSLALIFAFSLQLSTLILEVIAEVPLLTTVYTVIPFERRRRLWNAWSCGSFYALVITFQTATLLRESLLYVVAVQNVAVVGVGAVATWAGFLILYRYYLLPPDVFRRSLD